MKDARSDEVFSVASKDGTLIGCAVDGDGPPLLMVHGTGDTHLGWRRVRGLLTPHFKLYLMDRRGRGISGDNPEYSLEREWDDVAAVLDAIEGVSLFAHSFGAMCSLEAMLRAREGNLRQAMIYEPSVNRMLSNPVRDTAVDEMARLIAAGDRDHAVELHLRSIINVPDETIARQRALAESWAVRCGMAHTMPRELLALRGYEFEPERFAPITVRTGIIVGGKSPERSHETARQLHRAIPNSELFSLEGQGHFGMLTAPDLFARTLVAFLKPED